MMPQQWIEPKTPPIEKTWRSLTHQQRTILVFAAELLREGWKVTLGPKRWVEEPADV